MNPEIEPINTAEIIVEETPKLYAGKYNSVDELEKAYKNSAKVFNENKALQETLKNYQVPESYQLPEVTLPETVLQEVQALAKITGLNQEQFNKTLFAMSEQQKQYQTALDDKKKTLGDKLNVVQDYVTKTYPASLQHTILNTLLGDENAMTEALKHRDHLLNSQVPGLSNQQANWSDPDEGQQEMLKMAKEYEKDPSDKNRKRYINVAKEVSEARFRK
jgi:hypothetical protein